MFENELDQLKNAGLLRSILTRSSRQGAVITVEGRECVNFSSNDYLGLSFHPKVVAAAVEAIRMRGFGSGSSRLLAGGTEYHSSLEENLARWKGADSALLFNTGYAANSGIIPALASTGDFIFSDELNHASIVDGCRLSRAQTMVYRHGDMNHLEELLSLGGRGRRIVATDSVFSMDGDIAPLPELYAICKKHGALLYLDDAHGLGVLGKGRGALAHFGLKAEPWVVQMGTLSKALGSSGAFAAADRDVVLWLLNRARSFIFSTALPSACCAAANASLEIISSDDTPVKRLWDNRLRTAEGLVGIGCDIMRSETPILPIRMQSADAALELSGFLMRRGIYAPAVRPPSVKDSRIRISVTALHEREHVDALLDALREYFRGGR